MRMSGSQACVVNPAFEWHPHTENSFVASRVEALVSGNQRVNLKRRHMKV